MCMVICASVAGVNDAYAQNAPGENLVAERPSGSGLAEKLSKIEPAAANEMDAMIEELIAGGEYELNEAALGFDQSADDAFDLILRLRRGSRYLSDAMLGLQSGFTFYVPMLEIARATEIAANPDFSSQTVTGFIISEENDYVLNAAENYYEVRGERVPLAAGDVIVRDVGYGLGEFYVSLDVLNDMWGLELDLLFSDQILNIATPRKLPIELRLEREERRSELLGKGGEKDYADESLTYIDNDYRLLSLPELFVDTNFSLNTQIDETRSTLRVKGSNDFLQMQADYNATLQYKTDESPDLRNMRLRLTRRAYEDDMLPMGIKLLQMGDVTTQMPDLVDRSIRGRGVVVSNKPTDRLQYFDEITVEGVAPAGWEAELYRGNDLLEFRFVDEDGIYRFENVPLLFGNNEIKVLLYGPQGQVEERIESFPIDGRLLAKGEFDYRAAIVDTEQDLIPVDTQRSAREGLTKTVTARYGLNRWMTPFATLTDTPTGGGRHKYASLGLNLTTPLGPGLVEYYKEVGGGYALDTRLSTKLLGTRLRFQAAHYKDFESEEAEFGNRRKTAEYEVRADRNFRLFRGTNLGLGLLAHREELTKKRSSSQLSFYQSLSLKGIKLYNNLTARYRDNDHTSTDGRANSNVRLGRDWQWRTFLDYEVEPHFDLERLRTELRYDNHERLNGILDYEYDFRDEGTEIGAEVNYDFGRFLAGIDTEYEFGEGLQMLLRASTFIGPYGENGKYTTTSKNYMNQPLLAGIVYEDVNTNGVYDRGTDLPVEGGQLSINGRPTQKTGSDGRLADETSGQAGVSYITLDKVSLKNPFLVPSVKGYKTILRPGSSPYLNFPVVMSGAVDGTVAFMDGRPVPGIRIQLVGEDGAVVKETTTASDGFYNYQYVLPGSYTVRAAPDYQVNIPPRQVSVASDDLFQYGIDLHLMEQAEEAHAADEAVSGDASGRIAIDHNAPVVTGMSQPAPLPNDGNFSAVVSKVRVGEHPYKTRIVMDLSAPALYSVSEGEDDHMIYIDLPDTAWDAQEQWASETMPVVKAFTAQPLPAMQGQKAGTRLVITGRGGIALYMDNLLEKDSGGYMLYVDFEER